VLPAVVIFGIQTYLAASWWDWQFGASYGHRAFTDGFGLTAVLLAAWFQWAARRPHVRRAVTMVAAVCVALSVVQMLQYWTRSIPEANTSWDQYRESFLRFR
jgi:thiol:disulfide interchange protein